MLAMESVHSRMLNINSVRVDQVSLVRILDTLDRSTGEVPKNRRRSRRVNWRVRNAIIYPTHNDRSIAFIVPTRNLSAEGMAFLHGQMMHVGRTVGVQLPIKGGGWLLVNATVMRCRHVRAMVHEIGLYFEQMIDMQLVYSGRAMF